MVDKREKPYKTLDEVAEIARCTGKLELLGVLIERGWITVEQSKQLVKEVKNEHISKIEDPADEPEMDVADDDRIKCPTCNWQRPIDAYGVDWTEGTKYCPKCGMPMEGDEYYV